MPSELQYADELVQMSETIKGLGGVCEAAVTARTRCGWAKMRVG